MYEGDRITDGKRVGTIVMIYAQYGTAYVRWDGAKRQSSVKLSRIQPEAHHG